MKLYLPSVRTVQLLGFIGCLIALAFAYYLQLVVHLAPCPLCILDRVIVIAMALVFLIGCLHNPKSLGQSIYGAVITLLAAGGVGVAGRHVWLQHLPPEAVPDCGPGLDYMLETLPLSETLRLLFHGSGECAKVDWLFLQLSLAEWTLVLFIGFLLLGIYHLLRPFYKNI